VGRDWRGAWCQMSCSGGCMCHQLHLPSTTDRSCARAVSPGPQQCQHHGLCRHCRTQPGVWWGCGLPGGRSKVLLASHCVLGSESSDSLPLWCVLLHVAGWGLTTGTGGIFFFAMSPAHPSNCFLFIYRISSNKHPDFITFWLW